MVKLFIQNRLGQKISVIIERPANPVGMAIIMHGLGGFKEQVHITVLAKAAVDSGYTTVRFDTTNAFGESDGLYENATATNYLHDLEDVIAWAKTQTWYQGPFVLAGHSLGGLCTALYAEQHPDEVKALAPISTVVTGELTFTTGHYAKDLPSWKETGWLVRKSFSRPGTIKRLKYSFYEDAIKYDLLPDVSKLTMPVLLIVGDADGSTPPDHVRRLFDHLTDPKEFHLIKGADHDLSKSNELAELSEVFGTWLKKL